MVGDVDKRTSKNLKLIPCQICTKKDHKALIRVNIMKYPPQHDRILSLNDPNEKMTNTTPTSDSGEKVSVNLTKEGRFGPQILVG